MGRKGWRRRQLYPQAATEYAKEGRAGRAAAQTLRSNPSLHKCTFNLHHEHTSRQAPKITTRQQRTCPARAVQPSRARVQHSYMPSRHHTHGADRRPVRACASKEKQREGKEERNTSARSHAVRSLPSCPVTKQNSKEAKTTN